MVLQMPKKYADILFLALLSLGLSGSIWSWCQYCLVPPQVWNSSISLILTNPEPARPKLIRMGRRATPAKAGQDPLSFGSAAILQACWPDGALDAEISGDRLEQAQRAKSAPPKSAIVASAAGLALAGPLRNSIRQVKLPPTQKLLALTFDMCQSAHGISGYDTALINYLRHEQVRATFFLGGTWMVSHPERALQLMADPLFEVGNHSWSHRNDHLIQGDVLKNEILRTQAEYARLRQELVSRLCAIHAGPAEIAAIPGQPRSYRFPYGRCSPESLDFLAGQGLYAIQWSIVPADASKSQSAAAIARVILTQAKPGAIIILHGNRRGFNTATALPLFIPELRRQGYRFVTVQELLQAGWPVSSDDCYELRPGDNAHYDSLFHPSKESQEGKP
jgi:peptidoglycan/xylan/chitin deacetylase (PgdA/CDA1 family)